MIQTRTKTNTFPTKATVTSPIEDMKNVSLYSRIVYDFCYSICIIRPAFMGV